MLKNHFYRLKQRIEHWKNGRSWDEILDHKFDRLALLKQDGESRAQISMNVNDGLKFNQELYWITIVLSVLIATFGLLQNSVAVIIGAMLIAPLMDPIQAMAFGLATGRPKLFWRSTKIILYSVLLSIFLAYLVCLIAPIRSETSEILARTAPNLFDLFIAVLSAAVAFLAHGFTHLSKSVAGVAMAASLMPPLAVVGIELCFGAWSSAWGGFLLFITNLVAILLIGTMMFLFYGFNPHQEQTTKTIERITVLIVLVFIVGIPLRSGVERINENRQTQIIVQSALSDTLQKLVPQAEIKQLHVQSSTEDSLAVKGEIKLPENISLFTEIMDEVSQEMSDQLGKDVTLELDIVRVATVVSRQQSYSFEQDLTQRTREGLKKQFPDVVILKIEVVHIPDEVELSAWSIKTIYALPEGKFVSKEETKQIEDSITSVFPEDDIHFLWFPVSKREIAPVKTEVIEIDPEAQIHEDLMQQWEHFLSEQTSDSISFENLKMQWSYVEVIGGIFEDETLDTDENASPLEGIEANIFEGILSGVKDKKSEEEELAVQEAKTKRIQINFDIFVDQDEEAVLENFLSALDTFKTSFEPDQVEVGYRVFEYRN